MTPPNVPCSGATVSEWIQSDDGFNSDSQRESEITADKIKSKQFHLVWRKIRWMPHVSEREKFKMAWWWFSLRKTRTAIVEQSYFREEKNRIFWARVFCNFTDWVKRLNGVRFLKTFSSQQLCVFYSQEKKDSNIYICKFLACCSLTWSLAQRSDLWAAVGWWKTPDIFAVLKNGDRFEVI